MKEADVASEVAALQICRVPTAADPLAFANTPHSFVRFRNGGYF